MENAMTLSTNKTKIVCTIGPASNSRDVMEKLLLAGMNVARLNFSHGDFSGFKEVIANLRAASRATGRRLQFSSGVHPVCEASHPEKWNTYVADWLQAHGVPGKIAVVTEGPSSRHPDANNRLEIIDLDRQE
jgi:pyruvate kinase